MDQFLSLKNYQDLIRLCKDKGVKNKNGRDFSTNSIRRLLTDPRYVGKWEVNKKNINRNQSKLLPHEQYQVIDLPFGELIDKKVWDKVQEISIEIGKKLTGDGKIIRIYPLSGILHHVDGSSFRGSGAWKGKHRHNYYYNEKNRLRVKAELLEEKVSEAIVRAIGDSKILSEAIKERDSKKEEALEVIKRCIMSAKSEIEGLKAKKERLNKRLDFLIDGDMDEACGFKDEYKSQMKEINEGIKKKELLIKNLDEDVREMACDQISQDLVLSKARAVEKSMRNKEPKIYKNLLAELVEKVIVGELDEEGKRNLEIIFKNSSRCGGSVEDIFCHDLKLVEADRLPLTV